MESYNDLDHNKLIALLEGLKCENIPKLLNRSPEHFRVIGREISKYVQVGTFGVRNRVWIKKRR